MKQVTFIHHSSFLVELDTVSLLFDYVPAGNYADYTFHGQRPHINPDKPLLVFASHHHKDHYDLSVLDFLKENPNTYFIFAKDVRLGNRYLIKNGYDGNINVYIGQETAFEDLKDFTNFLRTFFSSSVRLSCSFFSKAVIKYITSYSAKSV